VREKNPPPPTSYPPPTLFTFVYCPLSIYDSVRTFNNLKHGPDLTEYPLKEIFKDIIVNAGTVRSHALNQLKPNIQ
jgi:hypothetical protein